MAIKNTLQSVLFISLIAFSACQTTPETLEEDVFPQSALEFQQQNQPLTTQEQPEPETPPEKLPNSEKPPTPDQAQPDIQLQVGPFTSCGDPTNYHQESYFPALSHTLQLQYLELALSYQFSHQGQNYILDELCYSPQLERLLVLANTEATKQGSFFLVVDYDLNSDTLYYSKTTKQQNTNAPRKFGARQENLLELIDITPESCLAVAMSMDEFCNTTHAVPTYTYNLQTTELKPTGQSIQAPAN